MPDTPAPGGDTQYAGIGPEALSQPPVGGRETLAGPRPPEEAERSRETGAPPRRPPTPAKAGAESAGSQAARALVETGPPAKIPGPPSSEPSKPTTRPVQSFALSALRLAAKRQAGLKEEAA